jgi:hypothetical protein
MGFNANSLPGDVLDRVIMGLEGKDGSAVDQIGTKIPVTELSGTIPAMPSVSTLAKSNNPGGIPEGAVAKDFDLSLSSASYALNRYVGKSYIADGTRVALDGHGLRTLEFYALMCRRHSAVDINADLNTVLSSTSLNTEEAVGNGAWTSSSSTPIEDMQDAMAKCGYGDAAFFGRDAVEALQLHPDFTARLSNYSGGALSEGEVLDVIRRLFPSLRKIVLGTNMYNSANEGQAATLAYQFDGLAWMGHEDGLLIPEQTGAPSTAQWRDEDRESTGIRFTRRLDIVRVHQDKGAVITGVI